MDVWMLYTAVHRILDKAVIEFSARNPFTVVEPTWANISKVQTILDTVFTPKEYRVNESEFRHTA